MIAVICVCLSWVNPRFGSATVETGKSCINTVLSDKSGTMLEVSDEFGANKADAAYSREFQWTALEYMAKEGTLALGNGYRALLRGKVHFIHRGWGEQPVSVNFVDVGAIALIAEYGLVGLAAQLGLLGYMLVQSLRRRSRTREFDFYKMMVFFVIMYLMLNVLTAYINPALVWLIFGLFYAYEGINKKVSNVSTATESK